MRKQPFYLALQQARYQNPPSQRHSVTTSQRRKQHHTVPHTCTEAQTQRSAVAACGSCGCHFMAAARQQDYCATRVQKQPLYLALQQASYQNPPSQRRSGTIHRHNVTRSQRHKGTASHCPMRLQKLKPREAQRQLAAAVEATLRRQRDNRITV